MVRAPLPTPKELRKQMEAPIKPELRWPGFRKPTDESRPSRSVPPARDHDEKPRKDLRLTAHARGVEMNLVRPNDEILANVSLQDVKSMIEIRPSHFDAEISLRKITLASELGGRMLYNRSATGGDKPLITAGFSSIERTARDYPGYDMKLCILLL